MNWLDEIFVFNAFMRVYLRSGKSEERAAEEENERTPITFSIQLHLMDIEFGQRTKFIIRKYWKRNIFDDPIGESM